MNHWTKYILLLLIGVLALMQGPALAHKGTAAGHTAQVPANCLPGINASCGEADRCSGQLCVPAQHDLNGDNCCRHNNIPVFGLPVSFILRVHCAFWVKKKLLIAYTPGYLSPGYQYIWRPPKID